MKAESGKRKAESCVLLSRDLIDRRSAGMTLFEVLLVVALLVVLGSLATPILDNTLASVRLRRGTDKVLAAWSEARTKAIEYGQVVQFRFSESGNSYRVDRWYADESFQEKESDEATNDSAASSRRDESPDESDESNWQYEASLPEAVFFAGGEQAVVDETGSRDVEALSSEEPAEWSAPILFFPDGTTSEVSLLLRNENERYQRATLRALTGTARASKLLTSEEVEEQKSR